MGKNSTIELNGKRYDVTTGALLGQGSGAVRNTGSVTLHSLSLSQRGRALDGFVHSPYSKLAPRVTPRHSQTPTVAGSSAIATHGYSPAHKRAHRSTANSFTAHQPEKTKTLMRSVVAKPHATRKPALKAQLPADSTVLASITPTTGPTVTKVNPTRLARANMVPRSTFVRRFDVVATGRAGQLSSRPNVKPAPAQPAVAAQTVPPQVPQAEPEEQDIFESAIAHATSHEQVAPKLKRHRSTRHKVISALASVCVLLIMGVFVAYLNMTNIEVHFASVRAGFHATVPNYRALGFALQGPVKTNGGVIAMSFNSGSSSFTLTQQTSNWDDQTLDESIASQIGGIPKSIQSNGRTIYLIGNNHAAWVSGGIRYDIAGNTNLNQQQIISIADSM